MSNDRVVLCGSTKENGSLFKEDKPLRLRMWGPGRNVHLTIQDVRQAMVREVPPAFLDLIDIAVYVYCADQATTRGGNGVQDFGENWRRRFRFHIPVRELKFWKNSKVVALLEATLSFLSEDEFNFEFEQLEKTSSFQQYLEFGGMPPEGIIQEVVMFSGGLDSLAGAIQEAIVDKKKVLLVNHRSTEKLVRRHGYLLSLLNKHAENVAPIHIPVRINKKKALGHEYTQRTRSFLYASLGATIATMVGLDKLRFYENGVVSLNLPPSAQVVGARATRTTHPQVLAGYAQLFSKLANKTFAVENPFIWKTKTDVVKLIGESGCGDLIKYSTSCTRTWETTRQFPHCGTCSQCIDRRFAVLAAGQEKNDPAEGYKIDLLVGKRDDEEPRTMLAAYVETANEIGNMNGLQFFSRFGEASRVLRHLGASPDAVGAQVFELHRRHAKQVTGVIDLAIQQHASAIRARELPPTCLVRLVSDASGAGGEQASTPKRTEISQSDYVFWKRGQVWESRFAGGEEAILLPTKVPPKNNLGVWL